MVRRLYTLASSASATTNMGTPTEQEEEVLEEVVAGRLILPYHHCQ